MDQIKAKRVKMTARTSTGAVFTTVLVLEHDASGEAESEVQSNFLWELFKFEFEPLGEILLPAGSAINTYEDVVQVK